MEKKLMLIINPAGAGEAIKTIILNFLTRSSSAAITWMFMASSWS